MGAAMSEPGNDDSLDAVPPGRAKMPHPLPQDVKALTLVPYQTGHGKDMHAAASQPKAKVRRLAPKVSDASVDSDGIPRIDKSPRTFSSKPSPAPSPASSSTSPFCRFGTLGEQAKRELRAALTGSQGSQGKTTAIPLGRSVDQSSDRTKHPDWTKEWYKNSGRWGIRRKGGDRRQLFSIGAQSCGKQKVELDVGNVRADALIGLEAAFLRQKKGVDGTT